MKIGLLLPSVYMGSKYGDKIFAPKELFINLANGLVDKGHEVYVYGAPNTKTRAHLLVGEEDLINQDFISAKSLGLDRLSKLKTAHTATKIEYEIDLTTKAYLHAKEKKLDIMHSYHDFMAHYVNKLAPIKTIYTIHDPKPLREHLGYWRLKNFNKDNYIFISKSQLNKFNGMVKSVGVIYHGVDTVKFQFDKKGGDYLAFLGRYIKEKGVTEAIYAAKKADRTLRMVGDDAYRALPYFQNNVLPHLKKGVVEDETFFGEGDRDKFLREAKALLFPILWDEPFGMVMIEAMSSGTPVIAFNKGSVSEVIKDGVTGFIIEPDDRNKASRWIIKKTGRDGMQEAINRIYSMNDEEYAEMRDQARKHIEDNFTVEKMVEDHEKVYKKIIAS
ncbi:MAG: hypothetical protein A2186_04340 [Candidatus Levybacteria bacterium RIFOXYA1_FULL_41_10]|nr:MAG: Glycosyltransferase [Candidatus Levybacteria bacterium GW2011_GWC2_40_7]KKR93883.1 MAG: Glycosyltransferase [Candidatus Levybacteria bacterium GW2011_GWA2_41_15]OGH56924.1 MAG: hypothetical protein A2186_04340 [Candidatus Levybacteria bacterium RIFOXYA1_FULL_41_10]OGH70684.1 MAG: hypothetical protein A2396_00680 [Candidatus Levybacteria bacterium RIFOXYB1_FULL_40_17]